MAFAPFRTLEGRQLETLLERYSTDDITEKSLPTARLDKFTQFYKITSEHRTIINDNDNDNARVTALWRYAGERNAKFLGRQGGAAADYVSNNFPIQSNRLCRRANPSACGASDRTV